MNRSPGCHSTWFFIFACAVLSLALLSVPVPGLSGYGAQWLVPQLIVVIAGVTILFVVMALPFQITKILSRRLWPAWLAVVVLILVLCIDVFNQHLNLGAHSDQSILLAGVFSLLCLVIAMPLTFASQEQINKLLKVFMVTGLIAAIVILLSAYGLTEKYVRMSNPLPFEIFGRKLQRSLGYLRGSGNNAMIFSFAWASYLYLFESKALYRVPMAIAGILLLLGILLTGSRNVWIVSIIVTILYFIKVRHTNSGKRSWARHLRWIYWSSIGIAVLIALASWFYSVRPESIEMRLDQHRTVLSAYGERLFLGLGPGGIEVNGHVVHNSLVLLVVGSGMMGLIMASVIAFYLGKVILLDLRTPEGRTLQVAVAGAIIASLFYPASVYGNPVFWLSLGILFSVAGLFQDRSMRARRITFSTSLLR